MFTTPRLVISIDLPPRCNEKMVVRAIEKVSWLTIEREIQKMRGKSDELSLTINLYSET